MKINSSKLKAEDLVRQFKKLGLKKDAREKKVILSRFFKTGQGQYGEGDIFLGITVPQTREITLDFLHLSLAEIKKLLFNPVHEIRLAALLILVKQYERSEDRLQKKKIVDFYLSSAKRINNWDLVDLSVYKILGDFLLKENKSEVDRVLLKLASSDNLWERRIAIVSTFAFIKNKSKRETFIVCEKLLTDKEELIHKACGWMLREVGKRISEEELEVFLKKHIKKIPRISLRYALERFANKKKMYYYSLDKK